MTQLSDAPTRIWLFEELTRPATPKTESARARWLRRGLLAVVTLLALAVALFRIDVPDPWADEAATLLAVERPWAGLWPLWGGQDAVMLPYYVLAKLCRTALPWLPTLVAVRTLSAVAAAFAVGALYSLVARRLGVLAALASALLLVSLPGFTRWAQDARPYALILLASTAIWLAWQTWQIPKSRSPLAALRSGWGYGVALSASAVLSVFTLLQWPAQVVAALLPSERGDRHRSQRALATVWVMLGALAVTIAAIAVTLFDGRGPLHPKHLGWTEIPAYLLKVFMVDSAPRSVAVLGGLAGVATFAAAIPTGKVTENLGRLIESARVALVWLVIPLGLGVLIGVIRPNLMRNRYWVAALAPTAMLAAIGLLILARLAYTAATRLGGLRSPAWPFAAAVAVASALLIAQLALALPEQLALRRAGGHQMQLRSMIQTVDELLAADPSLPVVATTGVADALLAAVRPDLAARELLFHPSADSSGVWPMAAPPSEIEQKLAGHNRVIWIQYRSGSTLVPPTGPPDQLSGTGFRPTSVELRGAFWVSILVRP